MTLAIAARLGPYEILGPLGSGGMGEVYRARDTRLGREVAVKVLPEAFARDPERRGRFEREAKAVAALSHPNVLALYDFGTTAEGTAYTVTELLEGETLRARLQAGALPVRRAVEIGVQVAHGLAAAHDKGIVHRDLKPENVWVSGDGRVKVLDFGLAKQAAGADAETSSSVAPTATVGTQAGLVVGTVGYMAPEQVRGQGVDGRADLFALGAVLYEMVSGRRAFQGQTAADTMSAILREEPPELSRSGVEVPAGLERIVTRCLEKQAGARFQSAHDLAFALEALTTASTGSGLHAAAEAPAAAPARRRLVPLLGLAALAVVAATYLLGRTTGDRFDPGRLSFTQETFGDQIIFQARFAPDGKTIVLSAAREGTTPELFVIRPDSPEPRAIGPPGVHLLSISRSGELAVLTGARFLAHRLFEGTLARMPIEGGAPRPVLEGVHDADWAPDGSGLAVIRQEGGRDRLEYPIGRVLHESVGYLSDVRFSPRGDRIAYMEHPFRYDDRGTVNVTDLAGHSKTLPGLYWGEEGLAWSRSGRELLFSASIQGHAYDVYATDLAGHRRTALRAAGSMILLDRGGDGSWLATRLEQPLRLRVRTPADTAERDLSWLDDALRPYLSRDGRTLLFTDQSEQAGTYYNACVRGTDGSPIVRLGPGSGEDISPDGSSVLAVVDSATPRLLAYPTGAGDVLRLDQGRFTSINDAHWVGGTREVLVSGATREGSLRCWLLETGTGRMRPATPEGTISGLPSPDGREVLARKGAEWWIYPLDGAAPHRLAAMGSNDYDVAWAPDSRSVLVARSTRVPIQVERVDVATGIRTPWRELSPPERGGLMNSHGFAFADDPRTYVYGYGRSVSTLFLVAGAR